MYVLDEQHTLNALRTHTLHQFVESLDKSNSEHNYIARFADFAANYGLTSVASLRLPPTGQITTDCILINTRPQTWVEEYLSNGFLDYDPVVKFSMAATQPFAWQDIVKHTDLTPKQARVMNHSADHGITDCFVVPVFESIGRVGMVSLAGANAALDPEARSRLTLASIYLHNKLSSLKQTAKRRPVALTHREREILKWIATGKSDWQIGKILSISQKTVNYHVENVKRKYAVATRMQVVVAALRDGMLEPE